MQYRPQVKAINLSHMRMTAEITRYTYLKNDKNQTTPQKPLTFTVNCNIHTRNIMEGETHNKTDDGQILLNLTQMTVDEDVDIMEDDYVQHKGKIYQIKSLKIHTLIPAKTCILIEKALPEFSGKKEDYI